MQSEVGVATSDRQRIRPAVVAGGVAFAAVVSAMMIVWATARGIGVTADSMQYFSSADAVASGEGFKTIGWSGAPVPLTHFPPLYPAILALLLPLAGSLTNAALSLNLVVAPLNVILTAMLARRTARSLGPRRAAMATLLAAFTAAAAVPLLLARVMAWTEPLFTAFMLCALLALVNLLDGDGRARWLALLVAAAAAATLTRYAGMALIGAMSLAIVILHRAPIARRVALAAVTGFAAILPTVMWLARTTVTGHNGNTRELALHPIGWNDLRRGWVSLLGWLVPPYHTPLVTAALYASYAVAALLLVMTVRARRAQSGEGGVQRDREVMRPVIALAIYPVTYFVFLVISISVADRSTLLEPRILAPALPVVVAIVITLALRLLDPLAAGSGERAAVRP